MQWGMMLHCYAWQRLSDPADRQFEVFALAGIAETKVALAFLPERRARGKTDIRLLDQSDRNVFRPARPTNSEERVERPGRRGQIHKTGLSQAGHDLATRLGARD